MFKIRGRLPEPNLLTVQGLIYATHMANVFGQSTNRYVVAELDAENVSSRFYIRCQVTIVLQLSTLAAQ